MLSWRGSIFIIWGLWICCAWLGELFPCNLHMREPPCAPYACVTEVPEPAGNAAGLPEAHQYLEQECKQYDKEHG